MIDNFTEEERKKIKEGIENKYRKVSVTPKGNFRYPVGREGLDTSGYDPEILEKLPEEVLDSYCGVGNIFSLGPVLEGEKILDIGCGAGVDSIIAALKTGPKGTVTGMDLSGEMIARAEQNRSKAVIENVTFLKGSAEDLPFPGESFSLVISNGVFNLVPDKVSAIREVLRVLKPGGRFQMADQVLVSERRTNRASFVAEWAGWKGGAVTGKSFLDLMRKEGFVEVEMVGETGFDSSDMTMGVLFRAKMPEDHGNSKEV